LSLAAPAARRSGPRRAAGALLLAFTAAFGACTLTDDEFRPVDVDQQANLPRDAGGTAPACAGGAECCDALPCAGAQLCRAGVCQAPAVSSGDAGGCRGSECPLPENIAPPPPEPSCDDGALGPDETDSDCGGVCGSTCRAGQLCRSDADCVAGLFCPASSQRCAAVSCGDGVRNGAELITDCGGGECPGCVDGTECNTNADCASGLCNGAGRCAAPTCTDGVKNGTETDIDCGGTCPDCAPGRACGGGGDCQGGVCSAGGCAPGVSQCCKAPTCNDAVANANESDVDCGGRCPDCATGRACNVAGDCQSQVCGVGGCGPGVARCCQAPSCTDGTRNGQEIDVDCGGGCALCPISAQCTQNDQCQSGFCQAGRCTDPGTCNDGVRNGTETFNDCGGDRCPRCADRLPCTQASDCANNNCFNNVCISCGSGVLDGFETDIDCGGSDPFCRRCSPGQRCVIPGDCQSNLCFNGFCG
jgi:hypothetical protein